MDKQNNNLAIAIGFAAIAISGSLVFFATQVGGSSLEVDDLQAEIRAGIDSYVEEQQQEYEAAQQQPEQPERPTSTTISMEELADDDAFIGDENAPVTIVEFSDYQCPFCRSFYNGAYSEIKEKYVDTGQVKLVFRDFPLSFHQDAYPAALAAECVRDQAGDGAYFEFHDAIFESQSGGSTVPIPEETMRSIATDLGVDMGEYDECYNDEKFRDEIYDDLAEGQEAGITGTPGFIINGTIVSGAQPFSAFEQVIEAELAK